MKLKNNKYSGGKQFLSTCFWIVFVVLLAALLRQSVQLGKTVGISAEPTIHNGQTTLDETWTYQFHAPKRGDMVVLYAPFRALQMYHLPQGTRFLKRIIGLPGDSITINNTQVIVNGVTLVEPYVVLQGNPEPAPYKYEHVTVPANEIWVMGDDRLYSSDSRDFGFVPEKNIIGRVVAVLGPISANFGYLQDESSVFQGV